MRSCHKSRRDRLGARGGLEHEGSSAAAMPMKRGRPISRGAGALGLLILRPVQYTAALRPAARPANLSFEALRPFLSGRGPQHCNRSSRELGSAGVTLASTNNAEMAGGTGATKMQQHCSSAGASSGRLGSSSSGPATSAISSFAGRSGRLAFLAQGRGLQEQAVARRRAVGPRCMSQTSRPVFRPQQAGNRRDGSPAAGGGRVADKEDERHSNGGVAKGEVDVREQQQQQPAALHRHHHHHHNPVQVDLNGSSSSLNGHHTSAAVTAATPSSTFAPASVGPPLPLPPLQPPPPLCARLADDVTAMKALGREGKWREALSVLSQLKKDAAAAAAAATTAGNGGDGIAPNLTVYNAAVSAVSRSGKWDEALGLLAEMRSAGVQPDVMTFTSLISAGSRSGRVALAEQVLDTMRAEGVPPNAATYNAVITGCSSSPAGGGGLQRALRLLERMSADPRPEAQPEALSYTLVLKACGREGRWETALRLLTEMQAKGLEPTTFSFRYALAACSSTSNGGEAQDHAAAWERCRSLFEAMGRLDLEPDRLCYKHAVDTAAKAGDVDAALDLMDGMEACEGFRGAAEYNQIIVACGRRGEWQRAVSTLGRIRRTGAVPDAHSFAMAMTACARAGEPRQAVRLLDELKREGGGVRPNTVVYNTLLGLCKGKPLRAGAAQAQAQAGESLNGYSGVNGGSGVASGLPDSRAVGVTAAPARGSVGSGGGGGGGGGSQWGDKPEELVGTAVTLLHEMTVGGGECAPDKMSFELVMQACVNAGRPESALKVFRAMTRWATGSSSLSSSSSSSSSSSKRSAEVKGGGGRGRGRGTGTVGVRPDRATYRLGLTAAAEAGDGAAAAVLIEEMHSAGITMDESAYHLAATAFGRAGLWRQAVRLADMASEEGFALSPSILTSVLGACAKESRWREALDLLREARPVLRQAFASPPPSSSSSLSEKKGGVVKGGGSGGGGRIRKMGRENSVVSVYTLAMVACRGADRHAEGLGILPMLREDGGSGDETFFRVALKCCAKAGAVGGVDGRGGVGGSSGAAVADRVLREMSAQGIQCRVEEFTDMAQAYGLAGRWEDALALVPRAAAVAAAAAAAAAEHAAGGAPAAVASAPDERMFCSIINAMGESGAWREAVELVQSMRPPSSPASPPRRLLDASITAAMAVEPPGRPAYGCACRACARQGEWEAVMGLIENMREDGVARDASVYASAMRAFVEAGEWERAVEIVTVEMEQDGVPPDAISYKQALRACRAGAGAGTGGRAAHIALALVEELGSKGLGPDVVSLEIAARACLADGRPELGLDLISEALESWRQGRFGRDNPLRPGVDEREQQQTQEQKQKQKYERWTPAEVQRLETMRMVLLGRIGRWEESLQVLDALRTKFGDDVDERAFVSAAHACASAGEWSLIQVLESEASAAGDGAGVSPEVVWDMRRALLSGLATAGLWKRAVGLLRDMHGRRGRGAVEGSRGLGGGTAMVGEDQAGTAGGGRGRARGMKDSSVYREQRRMLKDYRTVMHACLSAGAWAEALSVWWELRARRDGPTPCVRTYALPLRACGALGLWTTARDLLSEMRAGGGELLPGARHYAFAISAAAVADDQALDEEAALSGRGWGDGGSAEDTAAAALVVKDGDRVEEDMGGGGGCGSGVSGDGRGAAAAGDMALRFVLSDMATGGEKLGWEAYAAVCWARSQRKQWHRASLGVLELIGEYGLGDDDDDDAALGAPSSDNQQQRAQGVRGLYCRLLAAAAKIKYFVRGGGGEGSEAARRAVRQVVADAEERLAWLPGGPGPQVLAAAAVAFARAGDWEGARDVAVRFSPRSVKNAAARDVEGGSGEDSGGKDAVRNNKAPDDAAAATVAISAAVTACARAGELGEAEALAKLAGVVASADVAAGRGAATAFTDGNVESSSRESDGGRGPSSSGEDETDACGDRDGRNLLGLDQKAGLALAVAYERAGRLTDAEALRSRLQGRLASCLGLEEAAGVEGGRRLDPLKDGGGVVADADAGAVPVLPNVGGKNVFTAALGLGEEDDGEDLVADTAPTTAFRGVEGEGGTNKQYDLFLQWMETGEDDVVVDDDAAGVWLSDELGASLAAGPRAGSDVQWEEGLTIRELEGW